MDGELLVLIKNTIFTIQFINFNKSLDWILKKISKRMESFLRFAVMIFKENAFVSFGRQKVIKNGNG